MTMWHELAARSNQIATANGFDQPSWKNLPIKIMLIITELDEGVDYVNGGTGEPLSEELADATIRLLSILHALYEDAWHERSPALSVPCSPFQRPESLFWAPIVRPLCRAVETWRHDNAADTQTWLELTLTGLIAVAGALNIHLENEVLRKCVKNSQRPFRHGKVRSEG